MHKLKEAKKKGGKYYKKEFEDNREALWRAR